VTDPDPELENWPIPADDVGHSCLVMAAACVFVFLLILAVVFLTSCGGEAQAQDDGYSSPDAQLFITEVYSPGLGSDIECVVVTVGSARGGVAVSCNWP
jgi:hypothetical protein